MCWKHGGNTPQVQRKAAEVVKEAKEYLMRELVPMAILVVEEILKDGTTATPDKLRAAGMVFDRGGLIPGKEISLEQTVTVLPPAELIRNAADAIRGRMIAAGMISVEQVGLLAAQPKPAEWVEAEVVEPMAEVIEFPRPGPEPVVAGQPSAQERPDFI